MYMYIELTHVWTSAQSNHRHCYLFSRKTELKLAMQNYNARF